MASETLDIIIKGRNEAARAVGDLKGGLQNIQKAAVGVAAALGVSVRTITGWLAEVYDAYAAQG